MALVAADFVRVALAAALVGLVVLLLAWSLQELRDAFRGWRDERPALPPPAAPLEPGAGRKVIARIGPGGVR